MVEGLAFLGFQRFRVQGLGSRVWDFRDWGLRFRVQGSGEEI